MLVGLTNLNNQILAAQRTAKELHQQLAGTGAHRTDKYTRNLLNNIGEIIGSLDNAAGRASVLMEDQAAREGSKLDE